MRKSHHAWSRVLMLILLAPLMLGTTFKWIDRQGQVHYTDTPPPAGTAYEVITAPHTPSPVLQAPPAVAPAALPAAPPPHRRAACAA